MSISISQDELAISVILVIGLGQSNNLRKNQSSGMKATWRYFLDAIDQRGSCDWKSRAT